MAEEITPEKCYVGVGPQLFLDADYAGSKEWASVDTQKEREYEAVQEKFKSLVKEHFDAIDWSDSSLPDGPGDISWEEIISQYAEGNTGTASSGTNTGGESKLSMKAPQYGGFKSEIWQKVVDYTRSNDQEEHNALYGTTGDPKFEGYFTCPATVDSQAKVAASRIAANMLKDNPEDMSDEELEDQRWSSNAGLEPDEDQINEAEALVGTPGEDVFGAGSFAFKQQCYLMSHLVDLAEFHRDYLQQSSPSAKPLPTNSAPGACIALDATSPFGFINKLTQSPGDKIFNNMETSDIASLQPMIRLFKVSPPDETVKGKAAEKMQELIFDAYYGAGGKDSSGHTDLSRYLGDKNSRGQGVGIRDFTFAFEAENPYALKSRLVPN